VAHVAHVRYAALPSPAYPDAQVQALPWGSALPACHVDAPTHNIRHGAHGLLTEVRLLRLGPPLLPANHRLYVAYVCYSWWHTWWHNLSSPQTPLPPRFLFSRRYCLQSPTLFTRRTNKRQPPLTCDHQRGGLKTSGEDPYDVRVPRLPPERLKHALWDGTRSTPKALQDFVTSTCGRGKGDDVSCDVFTEKFSLSLVISKGALAQKKNELADAGA
jgi:hypothetical protein